LRGASSSADARQVGARLACFASTTVLVLTAEEVLMQEQRVAVVDSLHAAALLPEAFDGNHLGVCVCVCVCVCVSVCV
jgi:hypothetical protein